MNAPKIYGFEGGIYINDNKTKQYVGYGSTEYSYFLEPCFIDINLNNPGCFMKKFYDTVFYDDTFAHYLLFHSNLTWIPIKTMQKNVLKLPDSSLIMHGRIFYNGNYRLGKVYLDVSSKVE